MRQTQCEPDTGNSSASEHQLALPSRSHPDLETWIAYYQAGELAEAKEALQQHLSECRQCVELVLALDHFEQTTNEPAAEDGNPVFFEKMAAWGQIQSTLRRRSSRLSLPLAAAASILFALFGWSSLHLQHQRQELDGLHETLVELSAPQANAPIYDLRPGASLRSRQDPATVLEVPETGGFTLILNPLRLSEQETYHLEIRDLAEQLVYRIDHLRRDEFQTFTIIMPPHSLAAGQYLLTLFESGTGPEGTELDTFPIELVRPSNQR